MNVSGQLQWLVAASTQHDMALGADFVKMKDDEQMLSERISDTITNL